MNDIVSLFISDDIQRDWVVQKARIPGAVTYTSNSRMISAPSEVIEHCYSIKPRSMRDQKRFAEITCCEEIGIWKSLDDVCKDRIRIDPKNATESFCTVRIGKDREIRALWHFIRMKRVEMKYSMDHGRLKYDTHEAVFIEHNTRIFVFRIAYRSSDNPDIERLGLWKLLYSLTALDRA